MKIRKLADYELLIERCAYCRIIKPCFYKDDQGGFLCKDCAFKLKEFCKNEE